MNSEKKSLSSADDHAADQTSPAVRALLRRVVRIVDSWNADPDKPFPHPLTRALEDARPYIINEAARQHAGSSTGAEVNAGNADQMKRTP